MLTLAATLSIITQLWYAPPAPLPLLLSPRLLRQQCIMFGTNCRVPSNAPARTNAWPESLS
jgi:hypothetical protein